MCLEKQNAQDYWLFHNSEPQQCRPLLQIAFPFVFPAGQCVLLGLLPIFLVEVIRFIFLLQQGRGILPMGIQVCNLSESNVDKMLCCISWGAEQKSVWSVRDSKPWCSSIGNIDSGQLRLFSWVAVLGSCACTCFSFQHPTSHLARGGCVGQHGAGHRVLQVPELSQYSEAGCNLLV